MELEKLNRIRKVEAPSYLFTRIKEKIKRKQTEEISSPLAWILRISFFVLLGINISALLYSKKADMKENSLEQAFDLLQNNSLYQ